MSLSLPGSTGNPETLHGGEDGRCVPAKISGDGAFGLKDASEVANEDTTELFGEHGATATELNKLQDDIKTQNICGARILGLTLAIQTGRLHGSGDIIAAHLCTQMRSREPSARCAHPRRSSERGTVVPPEADFRFPVARRPAPHQDGARTAGRVTCCCLFEDPGLRTRQLESRII